MPQRECPTTRRPSALRRLLCIVVVVVILVPLRLRGVPSSSSSSFVVVVGWVPSSSSLSSHPRQRRRRTRHPYHYHYYCDRYANHRPSQQHRLIVRNMMPLLLSTAENEWVDDSDNNNNDDDSAILDSVTDAEALLACRAYLQRTNRLQEWTAGTERQQARIRAAQQARQSDAYGFFWNDPDELVFYQRHSQQQQQQQSQLDNNNGAGVEPNSSLVSSMESTDNTPVVHSASSTTTTASEFSTSAFLDHSFDNNDDTAWENAHILPEEYYTTSSPYFKLDDETPSLSHERRSRAAQRRFQDPVWKANWYEQRWGRRLQQINKAFQNNNNNSHTMTRHQWKSLQERLQSPRMQGFLSHPELAALSPDEIAYAIRTYVQANRQRSVTHQSRQRAAEAAAERPFHNNNNDKEPKLSRNALWQKFNDAPILQTQRQERSERARKAYATRLLANAAPRRPQSTPWMMAAPSQRFDKKTPRAALERVEWHLDQHDNILNDDDDDETHNNAFSEEWWCALENDLQCLLEPGKLTRRRIVLQRVLSCWFHQRGKCVPVGQQYEFVTQCSMADLGAHVLQLVQQQRRQAKGNHDTSTNYYATRVANTEPKRQRRLLAAPPPARIDDEIMSPRVALERVEWRLDNNHHVLECDNDNDDNEAHNTITETAALQWWCALENDLHCLLEPGKLTRRKVVLRRVLSEWFHQRGQCIRVGQQQQYQFVTQCSVADLGAHVLQLVQQQIRELEPKTHDDTYDATRWANTNDNQQRLAPRIDDETMSPRVALERVEWRLDNNNKNHVLACDNDNDNESHNTTTETAALVWWCELEYDLQCLLEPGKLTRRRIVLRRVLSEWFHERGHCVPVVGQQQHHQYQLVSQCSMADLGAHVLQLVQQKRRALEAKALDRHSSKRRPE